MKLVLLIGMTEWHARREKSVSVKELLVCGDACVCERVEKKNSDLVYLLNVVLVPRRDGISADAGIRTWQVDR